MNDFIVLYDSNPVLWNVFFYLSFGLAITIVYHRLAGPLTNESNENEIDILGTGVRNFLVFLFWPAVIVFGSPFILCQFIGWLSCPKRKKETSHE